MKAYNVLSCVGLVVVEVGESDEEDQKADVALLQTKAFIYI